MAQIGDASINAFWLQNENTVQGIVFTLPNAATINFVRARLREGTTANDHSVKAAIYSGNTLVAESSARQDIGLSEATYDFTINEAVAAGTYRAVIFADNAAGDLEIGVDYVTGEGVQDDNVFTFPTFPDPAAFATADVRYAVLVDYTESGGFSGDLDATESGADELAATGNVGDNGIRLTLRDTDTGALAANLTGLIFAVRSASDSSSLLASATKTTNASGVLEHQLGSAVSLGTYVYVSLETADSSIVAMYRVQVIDLNA